MIGVTQKQKTIKKVLQKILSIVLEIVKFFSVFLFCNLIFSVATSFFFNLFALDKLSIGGLYGAFYIFFMLSPTTFGYYCIHYLVHYLKPEWDRKPKYALIYMTLALGYTYVFGFVFPIIGLISSSKNVIYQFLGIAIASGVTFWVLKDQVEK